MLLTPPPGEPARLDAHFLRTLSTLDARPPTGLSRVQRRARSEHLARLDAYRRRALFPKNRRFLGRQLPHFIDETGTRCAMANLIESTGGSARDLVQHIARERNYERVHQLANLSELGAWLEANGLTLDEAAMIQPEYCGSAAMNCVCAEAYNSGMVQGTLLDSGTELSVTAVYGVAVGSIRVGTLLPFNPNESIPVAAGDVVFAATSQDFAFPLFVVNSADSSILISVEACKFPNYAVIPGPVPVAVVVDALSASSADACEQVVATHDAAWGVENGGANCPGGSGGYGGSGGAITGGAAGASGSGGRSTGGSSAVKDAGSTPSTDDSGGGCNVGANPALGGAVLAFAAILALGVARRSSSR